MKNVFYNTLLFACICSLFAACSSGDYSANPNSNANGVINPLTPLTSAQFSWTGTDPMSATINGAQWVASSATWSIDTSGGNKLVGVTGSTMIYLYLNSVYAGNVYNMNYNDYSQSCTVGDSIGGYYYTYYSFLGNSGEVKILENDSAYIKGLFYCKCLTPNGQVVAVNNGYFNVRKF